MENRLNKPYMEVEGIRTSRNTSKIVQTVLKKTAIFEEGGWKRDGGSKLKSDEKRPWGII